MAADTSWQPALACRLKVAMCQQRTAVCTAYRSAWSSPNRSPKPQRCAGQHRQRLLCGHWADLPREQRLGAVDLAGGCRKHIAALQGTQLRQHLSAQQLLMKTVSQNSSDSRKAVPVCTTFTTFTWDAHCSCRTMDSRGLAGTAWHSRSRCRCPGPCSSVRLCPPHAAAPLPAAPAPGTRSPWTQTPGCYAPAGLRCEYKAYQAKNR